MSESHRPLPKVIELVDATPQQQQRWLAEALPALSHEALDAIQREYDRTIDRLYPDDPGSLLNGTYKHGQHLKHEMKQLMTEAHRRLAVAKVNYVEASRNQVLGYQVGLAADGAYRARRETILQRQTDDVRAAINAGLAANVGLQEDLARQQASHADHMELLRLEADIIRKREKLTAKLDRARRALDRPHELNLKLHELLESMLKYQMSLNDRALRNPALADRLRMMGMGLTAVMTSVQQLISELNRAGETPPDPERLQQQSDELLSMAMEQMQQWQHDTRSEPDL